MKFHSIRYIKEVFKAYTEGIYADTPANRKLGRVGMTYAAYAEKLKSKDKDKKEKVEKTKNIISDVEKLIKMNDYINFSTKEGYKIRLDRDQESGEFKKGFIEDTNKKRKYFEADNKDILINSISNYLVDNNLNIEDKGYENKEETFNETEFKNSLNNLMSDAKENKIGTIKINLSNSHTLYLSRRKQGRWMYEFDNYSLRDANGNVISSSKSKDEEFLINKIIETCKSKNLNIER